jgi:hypothetical protein
LEYPWAPGLFLFLEYPWVTRPVSIFCAPIGYRFCFYSWSIHGHRSYFYS